jgi:hypothetical protein
MLAGVVGIGLLAASSPAMSGGEYPSPAVSSFGHPEAVAKDMTTFLVVVLVVLVGSAIFGFRGYWS